MGRSKLDDGTGSSKGMRKSASYSTMLKNQKKRGGPLSAFQNQFNPEESGDPED